MLGAVDSAAQLLGLGVALGVGVVVGASWLQFAAAGLMLCAEVAGRGPRWR